MNELVVAIYDEDEFYIENICDYLNKYKKNGYRFVGFTNESKMYELDCEKYVLLCTENVFSRKIVSKFTNVIILSEDKEVESIAGVDTIYRYQAANSILCDLLEYCEEKSIFQNNDSYTIRQKGKIVCKYYENTENNFFNDIILFSDNTNNKILFISLEEFSTLSKRINVNNKYSIGELLYFLLSNNDNFSMKLDVAITTYKNIDLILPATNVEDLYTLSFENWIEFIGNIKKLGRYDYIFVDMSFLSMTMVNIIGESDLIITSPKNCEKTDLFIEYLIGKFNNIQEKIVRYNSDNMKVENIIC